MIQNVFRLFGSAFCLIGLFALAGIASGLPGERQDVDFVKEIKPIFERHCMSCHGPEKEENFRIDERDSAMDHIEVGDSEGSYLYETIISDDEDVLMPPPDENNPLTAAQIELIKTWIDNGAKWPDDVEFSMPAADSGTEPDGSNSAPTTTQDDPASGGDAAAVAPANPEVPAAQGADKPTPGMAERIWVALGPLHPAAVHLPIGLLLGAGFFALFGLRGNFVMSDCAYYCLWLGALSCVVASVLGWSFAITEHHDTDFNNLFKTDEKIFLHRITGIATSVFAILLALYASAARAADPDDGLLWKLGAIVLAIAIGYVGHTGGELHYGKNHYKDLYNVAEELTGWDIDGSGAKVEKDRVKAFEKKPDATNDAKTEEQPAEDQTGQTSTEAGGADEKTDSDSGGG